MPLVPEFFGAFGEVVALPGRNIGPEDVREADVLLVRSVTRVDHALLAGSRVRFVGTATIGTDHVDAAALARLGVTLASAPGCNAAAVAEYVLTVLLTLAAEQGWDPAGRTLGVVGLGNVGSRLARLAGALGFRVLGYDPFVTLPDVSCCPWHELPARADVLSLHVPLTTGGAAPTRHLLGSGALAALSPGCILVNTSRGAVVDNAALEARLRAAPGALTAVLDVWEGEPVVMPALLDRVRVGTPHVAGYSQEGKWRGTEAIYRALCAFLGVPPALRLEELLAPAPPRVLQADAGLPLTALLAGVMQQACPIGRDDAALRGSVHAPDPGAAFDALRKHYPARREFPAYRVALPSGHPAWGRLGALGFAPAGE